MAFLPSSIKFMIIFFFLISAIPVAYIISVERADPSTHVYHYYSSGWLRECAKWDDLHRRFIVSLLEGGVAQVQVPEGGGIAEETLVIKDAELAGNSSLGIAIDGKRNRVLVVNSDVLRNRYSLLAAYELSTWRRLFLTLLSGPRDGKSFADDVAVDEEGNAYVTDFRGNKIWKVDTNGEILSIIRNPLFNPDKWYQSIGLNGIVYHPNGYLLVIHTFSGNLLKIELKNGGEEVKLVKIGGGKNLVMGDGLELISPYKLAVAGGSAARLVESSDDWETATITGKFSGPIHRTATAATVKDGKVYLNHLLGIGYPRKTHVLVEAVFSAY